jgi:hypothetical protein
VGRTEAPTARSPVAGTVELVKPLQAHWRHPTNHADLDRLTVPSERFTAYARKIAGGRSDMGRSAVKPVGVCKPFHVFRGLIMGFAARRNRRGDNVKRRNLTRIVAMRHDEFKWYARVSLNVAGRGLRAVSLLALRR